MKPSAAVESILEYYSSENPALIGNLRRILMHGRLGGTGKMIILPVDQGFEHGPDRSFMVNEAAYDPEYHIKFAVEAGFNAYAAPLGMLEIVARKYSGIIPMILKINNSSKLFPEDLEPVQVVTSTINDALRLGCSAIGLTLYPGSAEYLTMIDEVRALINAAKNSGLAVVIWSYPRGGELEKKDENALDIISYGVHMACLLGATIVKAKPPADYVKDDILLDYGDISSLKSRVKIVKRAAFNGKRLVVFSGGASKSEEELLSEIEQIIEGGADGSIVGRNMFQRKLADANAVIDKIFDKYSVTTY